MAGLRASILLQEHYKTMSLAVMTKLAMVLDDSGKLHDERVIFTCLVAAHCIEVVFKELIFTNGGKQKNH